MANYNVVVRVKDTLLSVDNINGKRAAIAVAKQMAKKHRHVRNVSFSLYMYDGLDIFPFLVHEEKYSNVLGWVVEYDKKPIKHKKSWQQSYTYLSARNGV